MECKLLARFVTLARPPPPEPATSDPLELIRRMDKHVASYWSLLQRPQTLQEAAQEAVRAAAVGEDERRARTAAFDRLKALSDEGRPKQNGSTRSDCCSSRGGRAPGGFARWCSRASTPTAAAIAGGTSVSALEATAASTMTGAGKREVAMPPGSDSRNTTCRQQRRSGLTGLSTRQSCLSKSHPTNGLRLPSTCAQSIPTIPTSSPPGGQTGL